MKKFCVFAVLVFYCSISCAQSLRGISGHEECESLVDIEKMLGSELLNKEERFYHFKGSHFGRPAEVRYICNGGNILVQFISLQMSNAFEAENIYFEFMKTLRMEYYGTPGKQELGAENKWERVTAWGLEDGNVLLLLQMRDNGPNVSINRMWDNNSNNHRQ